MPINNLRIEEHQAFEHIQPLNDENAHVDSDYYSAVAGSMLFLLLPYH